MYRNKLKRTDDKYCFDKGQIRHAHFATLF